MDGPSREPNGSSTNREPQVLVSRQKCPNCGRERAIVFPLIREQAKKVEDAPLVCLDCCLEVRDRL